MPATAKRKTRELPKANSFWTDGRELWEVVYVHPHDDVVYLQNARSYQDLQMRLWDWGRCSMREVKR